MSAQVVSRLYYSDGSPRPWFSMRIGSSKVLHTEYGEGLTFCGKTGDNLDLGIDEPPTCKACARRTELT